MVRLLLLEVVLLKRNGGVDYPGGMGDWSRKASRRRRSKCKEDPQAGEDMSGRKNVT